MNDRRRPGRPPDLPDVEDVAREIHVAWCERLTAEGVVSRPAPAGFEQLVPWPDLPEEGRELNRLLVRRVYQAIFRAWREEHRR